MHPSHQPSSGCNMPRVCLIALATRVPSLDGMADALLAEQPQVSYGLLSQFSLVDHVVVVNIR